MRSVEYSDLTEENHCNSTSFPFADLSTKFSKQGFNFAPVDVGADWAREDRLKGLLVPSLHGQWYQI